MGGKSPCPLLRTAGIPYIGCIYMDIYIPIENTLFAVDMNELKRQWVKYDRTMHHLIGDGFGQNLLRLHDCPSGSGSISSLSRYKYAVHINDFQNGG